MLLKMFGLVDLLAALSLFLLQWDIGRTFGLVIISIFLLKSIVFFYDIASVLDLLTVLFFILALLGVYVFFSWVFILWLLQKAFFSFVAV